MKFNKTKLLGITMSMAMAMNMGLTAFAAGVPVTQGSQGGNQTPSTAVPAYETPETTAEQAGMDASKTHQLGGKLTIHGVPEANTDGKPHVYEAYQVFAGDISATLNGTALAGNARILSNVRWGRGVTNTDALAAEVNALGLKDKNGNALTVDDAQSFAEALSWLENDSDTLIEISRIIDKYLLTPEPIKFNKSATPTGTNSSGVELWDYTSESKFDGGYYFIKDQNGSQDGSDYGNYTRIILKLVGDSVVNAKSDTVKVEKKVKEDDSYKQDDGYGEGYNDTSDAEIGETVPYEFLAPIINPREIEKYVNDYHYIFHDKMSDGLTFQNDVKVEIYGKNASGAGYDKNNKKGDIPASAFTVNTTPADGDTFDVDVTLLTAKTKTTPFQWNVNLAAGKSIEEGDIMLITFTAVVNDKAVIGSAGNDQKVRLEYSNNPNGKGTGETPEDRVITFVYELDVNKVDGVDKKALDDAYFVFYKLDANGQKIYAKLDANSKLTGWTDAITLNMPTQTQLDTWNNNWNDAAKAEFVKHFNDQGVSVLVSNGGKFKVEGLDDDTYYLQEVKAPQGYNLLKEVIKVEIIADTNNGQNNVLELGKLERTFDLESATDPAVVPGNVDTGVVDGTVANNRGTVLPSTGGIGTTMFYLIGGILLVGAAVMLVTRKRISDLH